MGGIDHPDSPESVDAVCVLMVEDDARSRRLARELLELRSYRILEAESGEEAVSIAAQHDPSLIILDIGLPGMDGVGILRLLRNDEATASIPVVAVTAYAMAGDRERLLKAGFDSYISKPIDTHTFVDQLERVLQRE